jgi:hypothetical protein
MGKHACWRAHPSDSMHRRDEWIKSSLRVSDLKAALHQFVTAQRRRRHSCQRRTTSCFSAKSFKRRSWTHRRRSLRAVYATWSGRHGRTSATSARDALGSDAKVRPVIRSPPPLTLNTYKGPPPWAGPRRASREKKVGLPLPSPWRMAASMHSSLERVRAASRTGHSVSPPDSGLSERIIRSSTTTCRSVFTI